MSGTKICIDCGKHFTPKPHESDVICEECVVLLKRRFWSSIKIGKAHDNISDLT
jgi:DNA-directed RNA polymerase subunit RPC12/RpoP